MKRFLGSFFISLISVLLTLQFVGVKVPSIIDGGTPFGNFQDDDQVQKQKNQVAKAFESAEKEIFGIKPTPDIVGPHPDPNKCICKGSGFIVHGDGHRTICPYHGKKGENIMIKPLLILEE